MARSFHSNCYVRTALAVFFNSLREVDPLNYFVTGFNPATQSYSVSGEIQFKNPDIDCFYKAVEKQNHITVEFHSFEEKVEETIVEKKFYGGIKLKFPISMESSITPAMEYLAPDWVVSKSFVPVLHATLDNFQMVAKDFREASCQELHGLDDGAFRFNVMGGKTIKYMLFGTKDQKIVYMVVPKDGVSQNEFVNELNEHIFIPETLYNYVDEILIPQ